MSATIYGVLRVSSATSDQIKVLLKQEPVKVSEHTYDGDELYKALSRDYEWMTPPPENDGFCVWSDQYPELHPVDTPYGPAYLFLYYDEQSCEATVFLLER